MNNQVFRDTQEQIVHNTITISQDCDVIKTVGDQNGKILEIKIFERPKKRFSARDSPLTVLFENIHIRTIINLLKIFLFNLIIVTIVREFFNNQQYAWYLLIPKGCDNFHITIFFWVLYYCLTCCTYFFFKMWTNIRTEIIPRKSAFKRMLDIVALLIILGYYVFSFQLAEYIVKTYRLPPVSALFLLLEQTRMLMKVHAFIRSNVPKILKYDNESDVKLELPSFNHFIFFTFVPTLIYKDEYPRTQKIKWWRVVLQIVEIFLGIFCLIILIHNFIHTKYNDFGLKKYSYVELLLKIVELCLPGTIVLVIAFYLILHQVQNLFAEILRFADRMFYREWWTACDFTSFYKMWNVIIHDFLFIYVYRDCCEIFNSKIFSKYFTFFISALVHEWIMINTLGFFFPIMFCCFFLAGTLLSFVKVSQNYRLNILMWLSIAYGTSILISGYTLEVMARSNGVQPLFEKFDFYIPRSLTCDCYI
ncbi:hypothetical protein WA026_022533 [Henosepilachna vigintioctopunctata]|uniref:O-acyltransferase n=1 Tax=Henosepilachna vigintioctopunctata TaxID=420089 RepID=A0AAW1VJ98_9CUCU